MGNKLSKRQRANLLNAAREDPRFSPDSTSSSTSGQDNSDSNTLNVNQNNQDSPNQTTSTSNEGQSTGNREAQTTSGAVTESPTTSTLSSSSSSSSTFSPPPQTTSTLSNTNIETSMDSSDDDNEDEDKSVIIPPLPPRWQVRVDPNGRVYFVDHARKQTSWTHPITRINYNLPPDQWGVSTPNGETERETSGQKLTPNRTSISSNPNRDQSAIFPGSRSSMARSSSSNSISNQSHLLLPLPPGWEALTDPRGRTYYADHKNKVTSWKHPLAQNGKITSRTTHSPLYHRSFRLKLFHFRHFCQNARGTVRIAVRRTHIFEDAYREIFKYPASALKRKFRIEFIGEEGLDYSGLTREFFYELSHEIFRPEYALFQYSGGSNGGSYLFQINPLSTVNPDHLTYFRFVGRIIGIALFNGKQLDAWFTPSFYKHISGKPVGLNDLKVSDPELHKNLVWMQENPIAGVLYNTFSVEEDQFGKVTTIDLKPNGKNIDVTDENKEEYLHLFVKYKLKASIKPQITALLKGIHEIVPKKLVNIFSAEEIELLISGLPHININDWKEHTSFKNGLLHNHPVVSWFWATIENCDENERSQILQFVTGSSRVPLDGFSGLLGSGGNIQSFCLERGNHRGLFIAHTCFNRLTIPRDFFEKNPPQDNQPLKPGFKNLFEQEFSRRLLLSVKNSTGFGIQ